MGDRVSKGDRVGTEKTAVSAFIERWSKSGGAERANYQLFLAELCDVLGVPRPDPTRPDDHENAYVFERNVQFDNLDGTFSTGRIDLYKRGCFVLETKQSVEKQRSRERRSSRRDKVCVAPAPGTTHCCEPADRPSNMLGHSPGQRRGRRFWSWSTWGTRLICTPSSRDKRSECADCQSTHRRRRKSLTSRSQRFQSRSGPRPCERVDYKVFLGFPRE
jgi:hypothetical protein